MSAPVMARCLRGRCSSFSSLWKVSAPLSNVSSLHTTPHCLGEFSSTSAFTRNPKRVNPAKKDREKVSLKDYAAQATDARTNLDAVREGNRFSQIKAHMHNQQKKKKEPSSSGYCDDTLDEDEEFKEVLQKIDYEIYNQGNDSARTLRLTASRKLRDRNDLVMMDNINMLQEAIGRGLRPVALYFSRKKSLYEMMPKAMTQEEKLETLATYRKYRTNYKDLQLWSSVDKSQGIIGVFKKSEAMSAHTKNTAPPSIPGLVPTRLTLVLDSVRDPGNLAGLIRTAAGVGAKRVVLTKGCCDPWETKALRAGAGGQFAIEILSGVPWSRLSNHIGENPTVILADICNADRDPLRDEKQLQPEDVEDKDTRNLMRARKREQEMVRQSKEAELAQSNIGNDGEEETGCDDNNIDPLVTVYTTIDDDGRVVEVDSSYEDEAHLAEYEAVQLPMFQYNKVDYFPEPDEDRIVVVIGGETGVSRSARKFCSDSLGWQVYIPMHNGIDSYNTNAAGSIILGKIHEQANETTDKTPLQ